MIINMVGGGGGAALNFKVVPGLTQPGTAVENTIWVKTEKIGAWYFSATQPEGMQEWDVWFQTGTESEVAFNALRKNGLQVYPMSAKQMVSGLLMDVTAMSHKNGEWAWWITYLYNKGDECTDITGGWVAVAKALNSGYAAAAGAPTVTRNSDNITLTTSKSGWFSTAKPIDVTNYKTLKITGSFAITHVSGIGVALSLLPQDAQYTGSQFRVASVELSNGGTEATLDVSNVTGAYLVGLSTIDRAHTIVINKVELIP